MSVSDPAESVKRKRDCLEAAIAACCGDRALNYGAPEDNFRRIAAMWNAWMGIRKFDAGAAQTEGEFFSPFDVAVLSILLKVARLANTPAHNDSWIDIAGYAACGADITRAGKDAIELPSLCHCGSAIIESKLERKYCHNGHMQ